MSIFSYITLVLSVVGAVISVTACVKMHTIYKDYAKYIEDNKESEID